MGMDRSPVGTWLMRVRTVSRISACRWLKAAMLLCTAVMWPSVSFSKDTRPSYCSSPFSMASYTVSRWIYAVEVSITSSASTRFSCMKLSGHW